MFKFNENNNESCGCHKCDLVEDYLEHALEAESKDELRELLHFLFEDGVEQGTIETIEIDIDSKKEVLKAIVTGELEPTPIVSEYEFGTYEDGSYDEDFYGRL